MNFRSFAISFIQPFLVSFYFLIRLFGFNCIEETSIQEFLGLNLFFVFIIILFLLVLGFILKSFFKASFFISILIIFLNLSSVLCILQDKTRLFGIPMISDNILLILFLSMLLCIFIILFKTKKNSILFAKFLILPFSGLIILSFINVYKFNKSVKNLIQNLETGSVENSIQNFKNKNEAFFRYWKEDFEKIKNKIKKDDFRDIYFIILDAYASNEVLLKYFDYDNEKFLNKLREMGFYIAEKSKSNYPATVLSIPATFSMNYQYFFKEWKFNMMSGVASYLMNNSILVNFFKLLDYKYFLASSTICFTKEDFRAEQSVYMKNGLLFICKSKSYFGHLTGCVFRLILHRLSEFFTYHLYRKQIYYQLDFLKKSVFFLSKPKFVFAHILCPHPHYAFNSSGQHVVGSGVKGYIEQLKFISSEIEKVVSYILENSERDPIIILQADHGMQNYEPKNKNFDGFGFFAYGFSNENKNKDFSKQRFGILNAYYLPDNGADMLYQSISPINNFRFIFKRYFGINFDLLEDSSYGYFSDSEDFIKIF